jgi:two-component sensor histidine kinase
MLLMDAVLAQSRYTMSPPPPSDLVAEANHRIANSLTLLVSMVRMQAASVRRNPGPMPAAEVRLLLEGVAARINTIGQLHRLLSHVASDGATNLKPHLHDVTGALVAALSSDDQAVRVEHSGNDCIVLMRQVQPIILILCEVFINAMKYAHPAGVPLVMTVDCRAAFDGRLVLTVSDDGVGLPEGFDLAGSGGLGFKVMRSLAAEIGAEFLIETSNLGLSFRLSLPSCSMASDRLS